MDIILCEGKNDVWFFHELMGQQTTIYKEILPISSRKFSDFQKSVLQERCFNYLSEKYSTLIYGDTGRTPLYSQIFPEVVADLLGRYVESINIFVTVDEDGTNYPELKTKIKEVIDELSKNKYRFQVLPEYYEDKEYFYIQRPKTDGLLKVKLLTVPTNIETIVVKAFVKDKQLKDKRYDMSRPGCNPHDIFKRLADDFFNGEEEKLVRATAQLLEKDPWVDEILTNFNN